MLLLLASRSPRDNRREGSDASLNDDYGRVVGSCMRSCDCSPIW